MVELNCHNCKISFPITNRSYYNRKRNSNSERYFCSHKCSAEWQAGPAQVISSNTPTKICIACLGNFPITLFNKKSKRNYQSYCKKCLYAYQMARWQAKKIKAIEHLGGKCSKCLTIYHPSIYNFHHLKDKKLDWSGMRLRSWENILIELDKCILLCANCHILEHSRNESWELANKIWTYATEKAKKGLEHGKANTYRYHKCRCVICISAHNKRIRDYKAKQSNLS